MLQNLSVNSGLKAVGAAVFCWIYVEPDALFGVRSAPIVPKFVPKFLNLYFPSYEPTRVPSCSETRCSKLLATSIPSLHHFFGSTSQHR